MSIGKFICPEIKHFPKSLKFDFYDFF